MLSDKHSIRNLVEICAAKGLEEVIISPGSRNAPLNISFNEHGAFRCRSVPDERCAGFVALGMAQQTRKPAIITCTSGSAALNFAPAISEAFYQRIPLLILTADRPDEWIDQGEGQSIRQREVYRNYIKASYHLPIDMENVDDLRFVDRILSEAIDRCTQGTPGPVHINIPLREPLYGTRDYTGVPMPIVFNTTTAGQGLEEGIFKEINNALSSYDKVLVLCGVLPLNDFHKKLNDNLLSFCKNKNAVVLNENTSNLHQGEFLGGIDRLLTDIDQEGFRPELLITLGHSFISKKVKLWLRQFPPKEHWHVSDDGVAQDVFQSLSRHIPVNPSIFFGLLKNKNTPEAPSNYRELWEGHAHNRQVAHKAFLENCPWSDMGVFNYVLPRIPSGSDLHLGNSSPVRYVQLYPQRADIRYFANRGVSGIDGSTSTAIGSALATGRPTTIITGDIAFFYDSNAFWQNDLPPQLRIILINNGGGGIFRLIPGPPSTRQLEGFFETRHQLRAKGICETFGITYHYADSYDSLSQVLPSFYASQNRPVLLEISTPSELNAEVYKAYFKGL
jgi:2-succinyl-5-enolpyruvyl-6-hydroxy-3-cyclohexene-1-carboxylate synthase